MNINWSGRFWAYLFSFGMVVVVTVVGNLLQAAPFYNPYDTNMLYLLCVAVSSRFLGFGPSMMASTLSVLAFDFFFIPPLLSITVATDQGVVSLLILAIVSVTISCLSPKIRQ